MKILIIGSEGFIGSHCVQHFSRSNTVWKCDVKESTGERYFRVSTPADFERIFALDTFDLCINASGSPGVGFSIEHTEADYQLNVGNLRAILDAIKKTAPQCRFISFSSAAVYGNPEALPVTEEMPMHPLSPYGKHKVEAEKLLADYAHSGLKTCSLRVFSAYGPGLHKQIFWDIYTKANAGKEVRLFGTGNESRDFIFIGDLVRAVECVAVRTDFKGEKINVASGEETTIREAAEIFLRQSGFNLPLIFCGEIKAGDPINWRADISKLRALGFVPAVSLEEGLKKTSENYCFEFSRYL